jgi:hypothetical protein
MSVSAILISSFRAASRGAGLSFVIASEAKQSMSQQVEVWIASSLALLAMTAIRDPAARRRPSFCNLGWTAFC